MKFAIHKLGSGTMLYAWHRDAERTAIPGQTGIPMVLNEERMS